MTKSFKSLSQDRVDQLSRGLGETKFLVEGLAMCFETLMLKLFPNEECPEFPQKMGYIKRMELAGRCLLEKQAFHLIDHPSDTVRGWVGYAIGMQDLSLEDILKQIEPLANDPHFSVREWAWIAIRARVINELDLSLELLKPFAKSKHENLRRFAVELTRPRGVWCAHIKALKDKPWKALPLFEHMFSDESKYVRLSVGNWLNDASKTHPDWVIKVCGKWGEKSSSKQTQHILKRALRSIKLKA